ncbi:putative endo-beta-1,4-glucanase D [Tirmania nivea]|nr:putative endo-beta-1,4-glucanase D [Tirmania nivea]
MRCTTTLAVFVSLVATAQAHSTVFGLWVNGVFQGDGRNSYIRSPPNNSPVKDVSSTAINCNVNNNAVASSVSVKGGDTVTFEWYHDNRGDDIIDLSHKGPVTVWIAPRSSEGNGEVWTKIAEDGFSNGQWAVERLIANKGKHDVKLPASLAPGDYLLRAEIIALHEADTNFQTNSVRGAQFYPSCSQITVTSGGREKPPGTFNFVGGYTPTTRGIFFNVYTTFTSYPIPGPAVWVPGTTPVPGTTSVPSTTSAPSTASVPPTSAPTKATCFVPKHTITIYVPAATTEVAPPATVTPHTTDASVAQKYYQCGGINFRGPAKCAAGLNCVVQNPYYYQCL